MNKAAQALGRLARGVPKNYSAEEIERRSKILAGINARKRAKSKKRRMPKASLTFVLFVVSVLSAQSEDTNRFTIITGATAAGYTTPNTLRLDRFTGQTFVFAFHTNSGFFWRPVSCVSFWATDLESISTLIAATSCLGGVPMEGAVIKNYNCFTPEKKIAIAKFVSAAFKEKHVTEWKNSNPTAQDVVLQLIAELKTDARWNKAIQHLRDDGKLVDGPQDIGPLIKELATDIGSEESEYVKERLFKHFWPQILRGVNNGFPEYYKAHLASKQSLPGN